MIYSNTVHTCIEDSVREPSCLKGAAAISAIGGSSACRNDDEVGEHILVKLMPEYATK